MGVFKLPNMLCEEMEQMIWYFWWGDERGGQENSLDGMGEIIIAKVLWWYRLP
jgi:hypothetical protein